MAGLAKRHRIGLVAMLLVLLAAVAYTGYHLTETSGHEIAPPFSRSNTQTIKLTTSGMAKLAAISPDGKYLAYVQEGAGGQNLWVSRIGTDGDVQVVPSPTGVGYVGLTFSPDGKYLYHIEGPQSESEPPDLYRVSLVGGQSRKLIKHVNSAITFSPDGKEMAFVRHSAAKGDSQLLLWSSDGGYERVLATRKLPRLFMSGDGTGAAWSPDGRVIAVSAGALSPAFEFHPIAVDVSTGQEERLGSKRWPNVFQLAWLPGGESLLMIASVFSTPSQHQIWRISYPAGNLSRITNGRNDYVGVSLTADGGTLATVEHRATSNIWIASKGRWGHPRQATQGLTNQDGLEGLSWTTGGNVIYTSTANEKRSIWQANPTNGAARRVIQTKSYDARPSACGGSPGYITFVATNQKGIPSIWRVNADGSQLKQLTSGSFDMTPSCSPDGKWVVYFSSSSGKYDLWRVSIDGGKPVKLTESAAAYAPAVSPDGKWISCWYKEAAQKPEGIAIVPFSGGKPKRVFRVPPAAQPSGRLVWMPDARSVVYATSPEGVSNIVAQPIDGGAPRQLTHYDSGRIFWFDISRDGLLALSRGSESSDVVLIRNFQ